MPYQPSLADVHIDAALTNFSTAYMQDPNNFIADKVFPIVPVNFRSDKYFTWNKDAFLRSGGQKTPYGVEAPRGGFNISNSNYSCDTYRWAFDLTDDVRSNSDPGVNIDKAATDFVMQGLLILREVTWATNYFSASKWGYDLTGGTDFTKWDDQANSNPIADVKLYKTKVLEKTGQMPNTMTVSQYVHDALTQHPLILDRYKYTSAASVTEALLAALFEVDNYYVARTVQVTSQEGQTITTAFVMGKHALLCYTPKAAGLMVPASGIIFVWSGLTGLNNLGVRTGRIPMPWLGMGTERIEGEYSWSMNLVGSDFGAFFGSAVS